METDPRKTRRWRALKLQAYRRDMERNAPCWICGKPIDYRASNDAASDDYSPWSYEPDHALGVAEHPESAYDMTNIMPAHSRCNRLRAQEQRSASMQGRKLGSQSRDWGA